MDRFIELKILEQKFTEIEDNDLKICNPKDIINNSFDILKEHIQETQNINIEWIRNGLLNHCTKANKSKYTPEMRRFFCSFISILIEQGSSQTQAITLLANIMSPNSVNGFYREALDSYNEFKSVPEYDLNIDYLTINNSNVYQLVLDILRYTPKHNIDLNNKPKSFIKTYNIYRDLILKFVNKLNKFGYAEIDTNIDIIQTINKYLLSENNENYLNMLRIAEFIPFNKKFED
jgi:hypothetical protein